MARIPLVDLSDPNLDPELRKRLSASPMIQGLGLSPGGAPNVIRAMANHPDLLQAGFMAGYRPDSAITPRHRELAYLTASVVNQCHY
jgi:alkylhydroperoxidase family enzyme